MLQKLLNLGLVDFGSDDSRLAKIEATRKALAETFLKKPANIVPATLITLDNNANEDEPIFSLAETLLIGKWKTLRGTHVNRPRELLRSIIISALSTAAEGNPKVSGVIWHTAITPFNCSQARLGKESAHIVELLNHVGEVAEQEAVGRAGMGQLVERKRAAKKATEKGSLKVQPFAELNDADLLNDVARAAGPNTQQGVALPSPNPHWPNAAQNWSYEFTPRMTAALVRAVNLGVRRLSDSINSGTAQFNSGMDDILTMVNNVQATAQMRLDVLWWSESKYSPSLQCGYRDLPRVTAALAMAYDLTQLVPALAPASVTYVLGEAIAALSLPGAQTERHTLADYLAMLADDGSVVRKLFSNSPGNLGRVPLIDLVLEAVGGKKVAPEDLALRTALNPSLELTVREFGMWVFHDLQAQRLVGDLK